MPLADFSLSKILTVVASNLTIVGATLYVSGWLYLKHYFAVFDVDVGELDLGWNEVLLSSVSVFSFLIRRLVSLPGFVLAMAFAFAFAAIVRGWPELDEAGREAGRRPIAKLALAAAFALTVSLALLHSARYVGHKNALAAWRAPLEPVYVQIKTNCLYEPLKADINLERLRRLKSTPKLHLMFSRNNDRNDRSMIHPRVYRIPGSCLEGFASEVRVKIGEQ